jgi:hypothetical protein
MRLHRRALAGGMIGRMTKSPYAVPLRPDYSAVRGRPSDAIVRALLAHALAKIDNTDPTQIAKRVWPDDEATGIIVKAATAPADTTTSGWASHLARTSIADLVQTLGPANCAGELFRRAIALEFGQSAQINTPSIVSAATGAVWIGQGLPIPIRQMTVNAGAALVPKKLATGFVVTRDIAEHSVPNAERLIRAAATESVGAALDAAVFDATAASATRPAGLRNSVTTVTANAGGGITALLQDLGDLAQAVAGVGGMNIAFVAAPGEAVKIAFAAGPDFKFPVFASGGLAAGFVVCVALPALVSAVDPSVRFDVSTEALVHMEDTTPLAIGTAGSPNTVAAPARSVWQTDCIAFRLILEASWGLRVATASTAVAWTSGVTW